MRELKFRAWVENSFDKYMDYEPTLHVGHGMSVFINDAIKENQKPLMQYTGLKDKNGREIYEKDLLDVQGVGYPFVPSWKGIVKFIDGSYLVENLEGTDGEYLFDETREVIVIGNIHENPELLGDDK